MDELQRLLAERACEQLVLRAATHVDRGEAAALAALFTPEAVLVRPGGESLVGRAAIQAAYARRPAERITRHLVTNVRVAFDGPGAARVESQVLLWSGSTLDEPGPRGRPARGAPVVGAFDDRLEHTAEGWLIAHRVATFELHGAD